MTKLPKRKNLELSVTNFGPIAKAEIDLRPMTVFVGPSNTGKSYLAILIYALHRFFMGRAIGSGFMWKYGSSTIFGIGRRAQNHQLISPEEIGALTKWLEEMLHKVDAEDYPETFSVTLSESVAGLIRRQLEDTDDFGAFLDAEIARCFGVEDISDLIRNGVKSGARVVVRRPVVSMSTAPTSIAYDFTIKGKLRDLAASLPIDTPLQLVTDKRRYMEIIETLTWLESEPRSDEEYEMKTDMANSLIRELISAVGSHILTPLSHPAHYLPADRTGVMHAHRTVVRSIIGQASRAGFESDTPLPQLSGVLADFLNQLIGLDGRPEGNLDRRLARDIERGILQGKVRMERSIVGYPEFFYRPTGWTHDLRLMNSSSMVSELTPVVLYLRHVIRPGEVLIIEEPESHLHPEMQVEFIRHLAAAVRAGARIMITTHSEWVLDALANLVHLSDLPKSRRKEIPGGDFALRAGDVGVWLFEPKKSPKGSVVREIPFSADYGGYASDFNEVAKGTYNDWARVANLIEEDGEK